MNKAEREHMAKVAQLPCKACKNMRLGETPAEIHHERTVGRKKAPYYRTMPLCPTHHRTGGKGVAFHETGRDEWESKYGTQEDMINETNTEVGWRGNPSATP